MLLGQGPYAEQQQQITYDLAVYLQIAAATVRAWKMLQGRGDLQGQLSKVIRGSNEPYAVFVDCLLQTAGRVGNQNKQCL